MKTERATCSPLLIQITVCNVRAGLMCNFLASFEIIDLSTKAANCLHGSIALINHFYCNQATDSSKAKLKTDQGRKSKTQRGQRIGNNRLEFINWADT